MSARSTVARRWATVGVLAAVMLVPACASIPDEGPVVDGAAPEVAASAAPFDFSPPGPEPGATPEQVVSGFLTALQATPLSTRVARQFLTDRAAEEWQPERRTLLFGEQDVESPPGQPGRGPVTVPVTMRRVFALDDTGRWAGRQRSLEQEGLRLSVVRDGGEWRLNAPPDAMVLPLTHFENRYGRFAVYFADPSGTVLIPEPVYLPREVQTATQLVEALLAGPRGGERGVDRSYVPPGTELVVSVPVDDGGIAQVPLTGELVDLGGRDLTLAAAQLVWTLRQVPGVTAMRLTADGEPVAVPGVGETVPVSAFGQYDPLVAWATNDLFGLRAGTVRRVVGGSESAVLQLPAGLRPVDLGVAMSGGQVAVPDVDGEVHVLARDPERPRVTEVLRTLETGPVARPSWDWSRALWLVPRTFAGRVQVLARGRLRSIAWPDRSLDGAEVQAATLSRDGSRLVLAVSSAGGSRLLLARVLRSDEGGGGPLALREARAVPTGGRLPRVEDLGWRDAQTLAVLTGAAGGLSSRVMGVAVDGQRESRTLIEDSDVLFGSARRMAASPVTGEIRVTTRAGEVQLLLSQGRWQQVGSRRALRAETFVG